MNTAQGGEKSMMPATVHIKRRKLAGGFFRRTAAVADTLGLTILDRLFGKGAYKHLREFAYWKQRARKATALSHEKYEFFYVTYFGLTRDFYRGKRILDVGCGPRGSLEWADMAARRVGLDPLAHAYRRLGTVSHKMTYVTGQAERIPCPDRYFDVVCSFNSLDHVDDLDRAISEITRVVAPGGLFLLITELNHDPTPCEPMTFSWDILDKFKQDFQVLDVRQYEKRGAGIYYSIRIGLAYDHSNPQKRYGVLAAKLGRKA